jgi:2-dehydro-3-deoxygalactonokinase
MKIESGAFEGALNAFCGDWLLANPRARVVASGMVGSKQGWREVPYVPCPAGAAELANGMVAVPLGDGRQLLIAAGVSHEAAASGFPDVMRGEETQIVGAVPAFGPNLAVLPGTHSKWAQIENGTIVSFATFMTGELYDTLVHHSILGRVMRLGGAPDHAGFASGVRAGQEAPGELLNRLFSARTLGLFGRLSEDALASYLSGLLIGTEIGSARAMGLLETAPLLLGSTMLVEHYARALQICGFSPNNGPADCAASGMARILHTRLNTALPV